MGKDLWAERLWWRKSLKKKGLEASWVLSTLVCPIKGFQLWDIARYIKPFCLEEWDPVLEQLWAIREGLA